MARAGLLPMVVIASLLAACGDSRVLPPGGPVADPATSASAAPSVPDRETESADAASTSGPARQTAPATEGAGPGSTSAPEGSAPEPSAASVGVTTGCSPISVPTGGTQIVGERCDPDASFAGARPAALVLTGCGGYVADGELGSAMAAALAGEGIVAVRIDYLAGSSFAPCDPAALGDAAEPLLRAVADTVALLRVDPAIDPGSIGAVGYSLGALTALSAALGGAGLAAIDPVPFSAVSLLSVPNWVPDITGELAAGAGPSMFVMSGEADDTTPPAASQAVVGAALDGGIAVELVLVPGQGHLWDGPTATLVSSVLAKELADRISG